MTEDVGEDVLKSINRYKKLIDQEIDERFVLYEFMMFRRAYDADYLDFNVEKTLADWRAKSSELGSPEDFFSTPLAKAYGFSEPVAQPAEETPKPESPTSETPATTPDSQGSPEDGSRPPKLDNPSDQR
jgi:hypothetical protein